MNNQNHRLRLFVSQYFKVVEARKKLGLPYDVDYYNMVKTMLLINDYPEAFIEKFKNQNLILKL